MYASDKQDSMDNEWVRVMHLGESLRVSHRWNIRMYVGTRTTVCNYHWNYRDGGFEQAQQM